MGVSARVPVSNNKSKSQASSHPASASIILWSLKELYFSNWSITNIMCPWWVEGSGSVQQQRTLPQVLSENAIAARKETESAKAADLVKQYKLIFNKFTRTPMELIWSMIYCCFISSYFLLPLVWPNQTGVFAALVRAGVALLPAASSAKRRYHYCRWLCIPPDKSSPSGLKPSRREAK